MNTSPSNQAESPRLEKVPAAARRCSLSTSQFYREIQAGRVGPLVKLGARASAVPADSVDNFIRARIAEATTQQTKEQA